MRVVDPAADEEERLGVAPRPGGDDVHYVHIRWRHLERPSIGGHYRGLRQRLDPLIEQLTNVIDGPAPPRPLETVSQSN